MYSVDCDHAWVTFPTIFDPYSGDIKILVHIMRSVRNGGKKKGGGSE
jgi:hypothetical protein